VDGDIAGLIRRAKTYDQAAFADLYHLTITPVYRYLSARLGTVEDAEELTQEVFLAAVTGIQGLRAEDEAGLLSWLFQIARRPSTPLDEADQVEDRQPLPEEVAETDDEHAELHQALERLTPEQREVIMFKYVLGYDNEQTARLVGKNVNSVNQLQHRALASLRRLLGTMEKVR